MLVDSDTVNHRRRDAAPGTWYRYLKYPIVAVMHPAVEEDIKMTAAPCTRFESKPQSTCTRE